MSGLYKRLQNFCSLYERGILTADECAMSLVHLLIVDADDDVTRLALLEELPDWYRIAFLKKIDKLEKLDFYCQSFLIGGTRTPEQVHNDALRQQELLKHLAPQMQALLA